MLNDFRLYLGISFALHAGIFLAFSLKAPRPVYVSLPVELMFYNPPGAPLVAPSPAPSKETLRTAKDEIVIPKKKAAKLPKAAKKETMPAEKPREETADEGKPKDGEAARQANLSSPVTLDAVRFPFTYYTGLIVKKISRSWQWSTEFGRLRTVVYFRIRRDGSVIEALVKEASGDRIFDEQALRAVRLSSPFPPLPVGYEGEDLGVYFEFTYRE